MAPKPKNKSTYTSRPHQKIPDHLAHRLRELRELRVGKNHMFTAALIVFRDADWGVPAIAAALAMDPLTVARRIARGRLHPGVAKALVTLGLHVPPPPVPADAHPARRPGPDLPQHIAAHLRELRALSCQYRVGKAADDPIVLAAEHLAADVEMLAREYPLTRIADAMGVTGPGLLAWVRRRDVPVKLNAA